MRLIKFRGQDSETKEWVYGGIDSCGECISVSIDRERYVSVNPKTVGQFTGCYDSYGTLIYDGDIIEIEFEHTDKTPPHQKCKLKIEEVVSYGKYGAVNCFLLGKRSLDLEVLDKDIVLKVAGNIHDNKDLF